MAKTIFRKTAIDRLSSPEQLDRLVTVTDTRSWLALAMLLAMIAAACFWSVAGALPSRVSGDGILITGGGRVFDAVAPHDGMLEEITVAVDDVVRAGDVVARLSQHRLQMEHDAAVATAAELGTELARITSAVAEQEALRLTALERRIAGTEIRIERAVERLAEAEERLRSERDLRQQGFSTNQRLWERLSVVDQFRNELADLRQSLLDLELSRFNSSTTDAQQIEAARRQFAEAERRVATLRARLTRESVIRAPADGRVTEAQAVPGEPIGTGRPVLSFESIGQGLDLVLYLPPRQGKSVEPGMRVQISPTTAPREEYGTISGTITTVSDFPATSDGMMAVLRNRELVRQFSAAGPPYRAIVRLDRDPASVSGFHWSSERGRQLELRSGTLAKAEVTVRSQRPIEMVIPLLREWSGI